MDWRFWRGAIYEHEPLSIGPSPDYQFVSPYRLLGDRDGYHAGCTITSQSEEDASNVLSDLINSYEHFLNWLHAPPGTDLHIFTKRSYYQFLQAVIDPPGHRNQLFEHRIYYSEYYLEHDWVSLIWDYILVRVSCLALELALEDNWEFHYELSRDDVGEIEHWLEFEPHQRRGFSERVTKMDALWL
jgi:hypothetical protein